MIFIKKNQGFKGLYKPWRQKSFFKFEIIINVLVIALSDSFENLCYGSTASINILYFYSAGIDLRRQDLMYKWLEKIENGRLIEIFCILCQ